MIRFRWPLTILWLFFFLFPKGGIKIGDLPITWGYIGLGVSALFSLFQNDFRLSKPRSQVLFCLLPFQIFTFCSWVFYGTTSLSYGISFFVTFFLLPFFFFFLFAKAIDEIDPAQVHMWVKKGIFFLAAFGLFTFCLKNIAGYDLQIPLLTTNYHDMEGIADKNNNRGFIYKLSSTYNNGNVYGICLLIFLPLYLFLEEKKWKGYLVKLSLILTFSRTVWIGLFFHTFIQTLFIQKAFSRLAAGLLLLAGSFFLVNWWLDLPWLFLFDATLGGRIEQLQVLQTWSWFPSKPFSMIREVTYLGILDQFGLIGLILYLFALFAPAILGMSKWGEQKALLCGLMNYLFVSLSDGALLLIPVMAFYWLACSLALRPAPLASENLPFCPQKSPLPYR